MDIDGREPETHLLARILPRLARRTVVDVGAGRGSFARAMLRAGADAIHAVEPEARNLELLRERFRDEPRVTVHAYAAGSGDGEVDLHVSTDPSGAPLPAGRTLRVNARSLASLVTTGEIPQRAGILRVRTGGHNLSVVCGLGELDCDVIMTEHWVDVPGSLGPCPWSTGQMVAAASAHGFHHFAFVVHGRESTFLQWDDGEVAVGQLGNLVFLHDRVLPDLVPEVLDSASQLTREVVEAAERRLALVDELRRNRDLQAAVAEQQLVTIRDLQRECEIQAHAAEERLHTIEHLTATIEASRLEESSPRP